MICSSSLGDIQKLLQGMDGGRKEQSMRMLLIEKGGSVGVFMRKGR